MLVYKSKFLTVDASWYTYPMTYEQTKRTETRHAIHIALTVQMNGDLKRFEYEELFEKTEGLKDVDGSDVYLFGSETTNKLYEFLLACDYLPSDERSNESNIPYLINKSAREQMQEDAHKWMQNIPVSSVGNLSASVGNTDGGRQDVTRVQPENYTLTN